MHQPYERKPENFGCSSNSHYDFLRISVRNRLSSSALLLFRYKYNFIKSYEKEVNIYIVEHTV